MSRRVEIPKVEQRADGNGSTEEHPAYGMIGASRVSGHAVLFGSDFVHNHFVIVRINSAVMNRNLSRDWPHARHQLIEVALSEAQWAAFVSSLNMGDGVPCTLDRVAGELIPGLPHPTARNDQFREEAARAVMECTGALKDALDLLADMGGEKSKAGKVREAVQDAQRKLADSLPWVAKQFGEHMEDVTEKAKTEIGAYAQSVLTRTGIAALKGVDAPIKFIEGGKS